MSRFIETICYQNKELKNIALHQERVQKTFAHFFPDHPIFSLQETILEKIKLPQDNQKYKIRILYDQKIQSCFIEPYIPKKIHRFYLVENNTIEYSYKYEDRTIFQQMLKYYEEIIIVKKQRITDTSFSNLAFFDGYQWLTPVFPLLKGTKREYLIHNQLIKEEDIQVKDLKLFSHFCLINAMLDLEESCYSMDSIYFN